MMKRLLLCLLGAVVLTASAREFKVNITPSNPLPLGGDREGAFKLKDVGALQSDQKQGYQGMCIYEDWLLSVQNKGYATLYKLPSLEKKTETFKLGCFGDTNHANVAAFGVEKYDENDPLPLVYVSQAYKNVVNGEKDVCYVERISLDGKADKDRGPAVRVSAYVCTKKGAMHTFRPDLDGNSHDAEVGD